MPMPRRMDSQARNLMMIRGFITIKLEMNYKDTIRNIGEEKVKRSLLYNSTAAFALIENLKEIDYNFSEASYQAKRTDIEALYSNFLYILQTDQWKTSVQAKMNNTQYVDEAFKKYSSHKLGGVV